MLCSLERRYVSLLPRSDSQPPEQALGLVLIKEPPTMGSIHATSAQLILLVLQNSIVVHAGLWSVDVDLSAAPSPEDGPPFSAHASRNRALLPAQICGIVGAYIATLLFTGGLLLTVGRRLRRQAQTVYLAPAMEMVKPTHTFDASPISPGSQRSWYSPRRLMKKPSAQSSLKSGPNPTSPGLESSASFDFGVLEADKAARQQELEDLYAAALEQEAKGPPLMATGDAGASRKNPKTRQIHRPPRLLTSDIRNQHLRLPSDTASPISNQSPVRAIYPPNSASLNYPVSPVSPVQTSATPLTSTHPKSPGTPGSRMSGSSSLRSHLRGHGRNNRKFRKTLQSLHISAPIPQYPNEISDSEGHTPLTPRHYIDPGAPPSPPSRSEAPTTPATYQSTSDDEYNVEQIDQIRELPLPAPQRRPDHQHLGVAQGSSNATVADASTSSLGTLPFRSMSNQQSASPTPSPGFNTKLTYIERRRDHFSAPRTGAATPYSPYMPFTPITPVTPHLTSRAERKQKQKEQARKALAEEDRVLEEDEMWGSAY